jgi:thiamine kinase
LQPENAIDSWRQWGSELHARPVLLKPLSGGLSNQSYMLDSNGIKMVLRLNGTNSFLPGADRTSETDIWQTASKKGIAPPLLHVDEHARFLVSTYIESSLPKQPQLDETVITQALSLLNRCHQMEVDSPGIDYVSHINQYWNIIEGKNHLDDTGLLQQRHEMQDLLEDLIRSDSPTGLCHHDPVIANFVGSSDRLYLIDWEYAAHGLLVMDYAALCVEWGINDAMVLNQTGIKPESLTMAKSLYSYLCKLWKEIT